MSSHEDVALPNNEKFIIGSDHAGYELKEKVKQYLAANGNAVEDFVEEFREAMDFGPVAERVAQAVAAQGEVYGILICGTGLAMSMAANKVHGIRATVLYDQSAAEYARRHNDANILVFGGRTMDFEDVRKRLEAFFRCDFEGGKYARRNQYLGAIESRKRP